MSMHGDKFNFHEFKQAYDILNSNNFTKIYEDFNDDNSLDNKGQEHCKKIKSELTIPKNDETLVLHFCNNLYKIIAKYNRWENERFENISEDNAKYCIHLKYWLYERTVNNDIKGFDIDENFQRWKDRLEQEVNSNPKYYCTFNKLSWREIDKVRSIYAFLLMYYKNLDKLHDNNLIKCKYLNFFGKGLKAYYESLNECSSKQKEQTYCQELNEFQEIYKLDKLYWENTTLSTEYIYDEESIHDCPLVIESLQNPLIISYKDKNNILYLSNQPIDFKKSTIVSTSSALGTAVGLSAFLFYLYKYTSLGSLFCTRIQKDNIMFDHMDTEGHTFKLPNSEIARTNLENGNYSISYYSLNNS
ncbi:PIR Superfamily Protein [Plasmodium ovale curtisi]|uniref:PIR Superfamily Protein n=1 Tax=Plasmodium ovale curtisi TaxID=864141 RepID=A0A1A8XCR0_PLAOA|nr:PIR Superfamily Protein [Plasmodium ovale curtisi]